METIKIRTPDLTLVQEINFDTLASMEISRELSGDHSVRFSLPVNADHVAELKAGRMLDILGQRYELRSRGLSRSTDDLPLVDVEGVHWFFFMEKDIAASAVRLTGTISNHLNLVFAGTDFTYSLTGLAAVYDVVRTIQYSEGESRLQRLKKIMVRYFCEYRLDMASVQILPKDAMVASGASFEYGINNLQIQRTEDHTDVVTVLEATGGTPPAEEPPVGEEPVEPVQLTRTVYAPTAIRNLYRHDRVAYQDFGDMTDNAMFITITDLYMENMQYPAVAYQLSAAELKRIDGIQSIEPGVYEYQVGDLVDVVDAELGIDDSIPIQRYVERPMAPEEPSTFTIGRKPSDLWEADREELRDQDVPKPRYNVTIERVGGSWEERTFLSPFVGGPSSYEEGQTLNLRASVPEESSWTFEGWTINGTAVASREHVIEVAEDLFIVGTFVEELDPTAQAIPLYGFISADEPDAALGQENDLWIQYEGGV